MQTKLTETFKPVEHLEIRNDSHKHSGHAAMKGLDATESHFHVTIVSSLFDNVALIQRHRMVNECLETELAPTSEGGAGVHAL